MLEQEVDLWDIPADIRVIPINQFVRRDGHLVMGRGAAAEAAKRYPKLAREMGRDISIFHEQRRDFQPVWHRCEYDLMTFVVKPAVHLLPGGRQHPGWRCGYHEKSPWCRVATLGYILEGLPMLVRIVDARPDWRRIALPRLGCGYGGLQWGYVRPILASVLDDRFTVVHLPWKVPHVVPPPVPEEPADEGVPT